MIKPAKIDQLDKLKDLIEAGQHFVIIQADNPDVDSLASSLALEAILAELDKTIDLYCGVDLPSYLQYLPGWDRVQRDLPKQFDTVIIVDTSSLTLLDQLNKHQQIGWLAAKPVIVIDHHDTPSSIEFAAVTINPPAAATAEIIYEVAKQLGWNLSNIAKDMIAMGILSDSLGLVSDNASARTVAIMAELVDAGVSLAKLDNARRQTMRREPELIHYKGRLLQRVEFYLDNKIAMLTIPWAEIEKYSPLYNPPMLVLDDMRLGKGTEIAVAFKIYQDGRLTAKIRTNYRFGVADKLAEHFGGGGHPYASGFRLAANQAKPIEELKAEFVKIASQILSKHASNDKTI